MRTILRFAVIAALVFVGAAEALAQFAGAPGAVGVPALVAPDSGSIINIGKAFGPALQDYVNTVIGALITAGLAWVAASVQKRTGLDISKISVETDAGHRQTIQDLTKRLASSLVADGFVAVKGLKVDVHSKALADAANLGMRMAPDALARFALSPEDLAARIVDAIPQLPAIASAVSRQAPEDLAKMATHASDAVSSALKP